ncbi:MAG TPA: YigZ family protein [Bacillota bacterium]|nr:YigZ family protein [Bacillota bacterium]HOA35515.1 YigZ family protein [Bacillota bacterium]HOJ84467.1 YigZ family protein [Bacillota bacterium]HOL15836.1 YigZ family protein [Bacillota bacterium]HPZ12181.1 YigZ family protein [Bacillota bacterium]
MSEYRYRTLREEVRVRFNVNNSRFIATAAPVSGEEAAEQFVERIRAEFPDATHHAYAYRIGAGGSLVERASDDREPAGTAGLPMLQLLQGEGLSDLVVVATRYFGGIKLGIGGLTRAYRHCARACLEAAALVERERLCYCRMIVSYGEIGALLRQLEAMGAEIIATDYAAEVSVIAALPYRLAGSLRKRFVELSRGSGLWEELEGPPDN